MARAHMMHIDPESIEKKLNEREKGYLRCNQSAPAGPFGSRQAEGGFMELARVLGINVDNPEHTISVVRDVRVFACSSLSKSPVIHIKSTSKVLLSKCVLEGPMSIAIPSDY